MIFQNRISFLYNASILLLVIAGCTFINPKSEQPAVTSSTAGMPPISQVPGLSPSPGWNVLVTPTFIPPVPTLHPFQQAHMIGLLQSNECNLPCYMNITPGKTSWNEANAILDSIGASFRGNYTEGGLPVYGFTLWIGNQAINEITPNPEVVVGDREIVHEEDLTIRDNKVQRLQVRIHTKKYLIKFQKYWSRYTMREILLRQGFPDKMFTHISRGTGYGLVLVYEKVGLVAEFNGSMQEKLICTENEKLIIGLDLTLTNPTSGLSIYKPGWVPPTDRNVWLPIIEVLGLDEKEFYNQIITNQETCFEVKTVAP